MARELVSSALEELEDDVLAEAVVQLVKTIVIYKLPNFSRQELEAMFELAELKETRAENYAVNPPTEENTKN